MGELLNSEYLFSRKVDEKTDVKLTLHINYEANNYDFMEEGEEGLSIRNHNNDIEFNKAKLLLGLEILDFVKKELKNDR